MSLLKQVSQNLEKELDSSDIIQSKLDSDSTDVIIQDIGLYSHPFLMYKDRRTFQSYKQEENTERSNPTECDLYVYPLEAKNFSLLPFKTAKSKIEINEDNFEYRELVNWVSNTDDSLHVYQKEPRKMSRNFIEFNNLDDYNKCTTSSLLTLAVTFEDTETGVLYTGVSPIYDKKFSVKEFIEQTTVKEDEEGSEKQIRTVEEVEAEINGDQLTSDDWTITLANMYSNTWYTLPLLEKSKEKFYQEYLEFIQKMVDSEDKNGWFTVEGVVETADIKYSDSLVINFSMGHKRLSFKPSLKEQNITKDFLKSYDPESNTVQVKIRSMGHGKIEEFTDSVSYSSDNGWFIQPT